VDERVRAALAFVEKQTLRSDELTEADAEQAYAAGVSPGALRDAARVAALFNMILRLADSFAWEVPPWERLLERAPAMLAGGYAMRAVRERSGAA
jgi:alkylhydroperoxidase family enzyme